MNDNFDIVGARELTNEELMLIQGGGFFGDAWNAVKSAASSVGHAAESAWNAVSSKKGRETTETIGGIAGAIAGIIAIFA